MSRTETERLYEQKLKRRGERSMLLQTWLTENMLAHTEKDFRLHELRIKLSDTGHSPLLVIVKCRIEGRPFVGFHGADTFEDAMSGAMERIMNNDMKWREDQPYRKEGE